MTLLPKSSHQHFVVFLDKVEATVIGHEGHELAILDQLHPDSLPDGRVGLLRLDAYFLQHNNLGMGGAPKGVGLEGHDQVRLLVQLVVPLLVVLVAVRRPLHLPILPMRGPEPKSTIDIYYEL